MIAKLIGTLLFSIFLSFSSNCLSYELNSDVEEYLENFTREEAVAQLFFVGIPSDYKSINSDQYTQKLLEMNIGGVMLNAYNLPGYLLEKKDKKSAYGDVYNFIKSLRNKSDSGNDLVIAADIESSRFTSLRYPFTIPPSALTIAATNDTKYAYLSGKLVGYQLQNAGINAVFGPVTDISKPQQGKLNTALKNRSFGSNSNTTLNMASRYLAGLKEHNIISFVKHVPGFGSVDKNPHNNESRFQGSKSNLEEQLKIIANLEPLPDGAMTSHVSISASKITDPVTVNEKLINKIFGENGHLRKFGESGLIITDDLSNMEAINILKHKKGWSYKDIALASFKAGHDIILFSHIAPHSNFGLKDLQESINLITEYSRSTEGQKRLYKSLSKILKVKRSLNQTSKIGIKPKKQLDFNATEIFSETEFKNANEFLKDLYNNALIEINTNLDSLSILERLESNQKIAFIGRSKYFENIKNESKDKRIIYIKKENFERKGRKLKLKSYRKAIEKQLKNNNYVIILAENKDDFDIIHHIYLYDNILTKNLIISVHESPEILERNLVVDANIIGSFSQDKLSSGAVARVIFGTRNSKNISNMPLDLNDGTHFDNHEKAKLKIDSKASQKIIFFKTPQEKILHDKLTSIKNQFFKIVAISFIPTTILISIFIYFIAAYLDSKHENLKKREVFSALSPFYWVKSHPALTFIIILLVTVQIQLLMPESKTKEFLAKHFDTFASDYILEKTEEIKTIAPDLYSDNISQWD